MLLKTRILDYIHVASSLTSLHNFALNMGRYFISNSFLIQSVRRHRSAESGMSQEVSWTMVWRMTSGSLHVISPWTTTSQKQHWDRSNVRNHELIQSCWECNLVQVFYTTVWQLLEWLNKSYHVTSNSILTDLLI